MNQTTSKRSALFGSPSCNAFFIDPEAFPPGFADELCGETFRENEGDFNGATRAYKDPDGDDVIPLRDWRMQYKLISALPLVECD
jgi:hypothetical protein